MAFIKGSFKSLFAGIAAYLCNITVICRENSFPNQDDDFIYGEEGKQYFVVFPFTTSKKFIGDDCVIRGITNIVPLWTYTGITHAVENLLGSRVSIFDLSMVAASGCCLNVQGNNTGNVFERMNIVQCVFNGKCFADIDGAGAFIFNLSTVIVDGTVADAIDLNSTDMQIFNMSEVAFIGIPSGGSIVNFNSSTVQEIEHRNIIYFNTNSPDGHVYKGLANSGNVLVNGSFECVSGNFVSSNQPLVGIGVNDKSSSFKDNDGLDDTQVVARSYLTSTATVSIATSGTYYEMAGGTLDTRTNGKFSYTSRGGVKNESDKSFFVIILAEFVVDTGGNKDIGVAMFIDNGMTEVVLPESEKEYSASRDEPVSSTSLIKLEPQDEIFPKFKNNTNMSDFDVTNYTVIPFKAT